ncbi:MAG: hypothetical protein OQK66_07060 [Prosthecochloris sp.]|uniref:Uncharacterized protein n=1 Tax=Prosthecochloris aestuarii (strain DSM 271 / SK 413) TaxID=290512 RepID=B4S7E7_PROA2|nr:MULTISPECIES: hypothetical protein [Prosthecochloris]ACF45984.1 conserved hypothetical protein [Prosthecochloris aestuarii DSM 271]MCW8798711.1 hypothetical protein [Prosthecochloris sp.]NEX12511.1 hypothetical protein [Prosthecochloris sp.]
MLSFEELRGAMKGEIFIHQNLAEHDVKKVDAVADVVIRPSGKKELKTVLKILHQSRFPHVVIDRKGRVVFPDKRYHGAVIVLE